MAPLCQSGSATLHEHLLPVKLKPVQKQTSPDAQSTAAAEAGAADAEAGRASVVAAAALTARVASSGESRCGRRIAERFMGLFLLAMRLLVVGQPEGGNACPDRARKPDGLGRRDGRTPATWRVI
jgi:hypothetical protein